MADAEVTHERASEPPPLTVDGLLKLDNVLAEKKPPARVARQLTTRRLYLSGARTAQDIERGDHMDGFEFVAQLRARREAAHR